MFGHIRYNEKSYLCEHFLIDAYKYYTGVDLKPRLLTSGFFDKLKVKNFKRTTEPKDNTIVLFRAKNRAHVGLYKNGRVLHLIEAGVVWQLIDLIKTDFDRVVFYEFI